MAPKLTKNQIRNRSGRSLSRPSLFPQTSSQTLCQHTRSSQKRNKKSKHCPKTMKFFSILELDERRSLFKSFVWKRTKGQYRNQPNKKSVSYQFDKQFISSPQDCFLSPNSIETNKRSKKSKLQVLRHIFSSRTKFLSTKFLAVVGLWSRSQRFLQEDCLIF